MNESDIISNAIKREKSPIKTLDFLQSLISEFNNPILMNEEQKAENRQIAETIIQQLGGRKFITMTGAKEFSIGTRQVSFRLPAHFANHGINCVSIKLNGRDTYDIEFGKKRSIHYVELLKLEDIYANVLQEVFTRHTGLDTHL